MQGAKLDEPDRAPGVPASAVWDFESQAWVLGRRDERGELHGLVRFFSDQGKLVLEQELRHGQRHGAFRRFHGSGELAQAGRYFRGALDGLSLSHSEGDDEDSIRDCCVPHGARLLRQEFRHGAPLAESFHAADGSLISLEGERYELREREDDVLLMHYGFWPSYEMLPGEVEQVACVAQPFDALRDAIIRAAQRVSAYRAELLISAPALAPPDVSRLTTDLPLRQLCFAVAGSEQPVVVDERPNLTNLTPRELALGARVEWSALCWLCWAAGLERIALPEHLTSRPELSAALLHASARIAALIGPEPALDSSGHFHGLDETHLPASALAHLAEHYVEIRAVLLFASDPECVSAWQDDLGRAPEC